MSTVILLLVLIPFSSSSIPFEGERHRGVMNTFMRNEWCCKTCWLL